MKKLLLIAIVQLWLAACISVYRVELRRVDLPCNSILAEPINALVEQEIKQQQLIKMIEEAYNILEDQMEVRNFQDYDFWTGGDVWDVQWDTLGVNYTVSVKDNIIYRIDIRYQERSQPSVKRIIECLGDLPRHYIAIYQTEIPPDALSYYSASVTWLSMILYIKSEIGIDFCHDDRGEHTNRACRRHSVASASASRNGDSANRG